MSLIKNPTKIMHSHFKKDIKRIAKDCNDLEEFEIRLERFFAHTIYDVGVKEDCNPDYIPFYVEMIEFCVDQIDIGFIANFYWKEPDIKKEQRQKKKDLILASKMINGKIYKKGELPQ